MCIDVTKENLEIEIKIKPNSDEVIDKLLKWLYNNTFQTREVFQVDRYFENKNSTFLYVDKNGFKDADEWLRVRTIDKTESWICYKKCHRKGDGIIFYSDEVETRIENPNKMYTILELLKYQLIIEVQKIRKSYSYSDFQIDIDTVIGIGTFIEIEYRGKIDNLKDGRILIKKFLNIIGIQNYEEVYSSYPYMVLNKNILGNCET